MCHDEAKLRSYARESGELGHRKIRGGYRERETVQYLVLYQRTRLGGALLLMQLFKLGLFFLLLLSLKK